MSKRALVLLIGVVLIGNVDALAVAPPQIVDPREDVFDSKPSSSSPRLESPRPDTASPDSVSAPPVAPAVAPEPSANPLWAVPLRQLTATRERPLFSPTRRPPATLAAKSAPAPKAPPPKPAEPEKPQLSLVGTIAGGAAGGIGLFVSMPEKSVLRLKPGENHKGWVLRTVRPRQVELAKGLDSVVLDLPQPDMKTAAGPPAVVSPAVAAMPSSPVASSLPVSTAKANGAMPAAAPGVATIVVRPPVFNPPPVSANPFSKGRLP